MCTLELDHPDTVEAKARFTIGESLLDATTTEPARRRIALGYVSITWRDPQPTRDWLHLDADLVLDVDANGRACGAELLSPQAGRGPDAVDYLREPENNWLGDLLAAARERWQMLDRGQTR